MITRPKFPLNPSHNAEYVDPNNIMWVYDAIQNNWIQRGLITTIPQVSRNTDGLVDPETYDKLIELQEFSQEINLSTFKLSPGTNAYYYYFYGPDGLIDVKHEGNSQIRIELNEQKLVSLLYKYVCDGDRGLQGEQGRKGISGTSSGSEANFILNRENNTISGQAYVPIPIGTYVDSGPITNIALRIYQSETTVNGLELQPQLEYWTTLLANPLVDNEEKQRISVLRQASIDQGLGLRTQDLDLSPQITSRIRERGTSILWIDINPTTGNHTIVSEAVEIQSINIEYDQTIGVITFNIEGDFPESVFFKARQRGPRGEQGRSTQNFLEQRECQFPEDSNVRPDAVLTNLRLDCEENRIYASYARLESQDTFNQVSTDPSVGVSATNPPLRGNYVAVEKVANQSKRTSRLNTALPELEINDPILINWEPQDGCRTKRRFLDHNFDWIPLTDIPECDERLTWYSPTEVRRGMYPYPIIIPLEPPTDKCCQDPFFIFPETGDVVPEPATVTRIENNVDFINNTSFSTNNPNDPEESTDSP